MTTSVKPRLGILGAGQLALMLAQASKAIGVDVICAGQPGDCAEQISEVLAVDLDDASAVAAFARLLNAPTENAASATKIRK